MSKSPHDGWTKQEQIEEQFKPRFFNPHQQDIDEAKWCVRTNEPWTCAHDPECRDVLFAGLEQADAKLAKAIGALEKIKSLPCHCEETRECPWHISRLALGELNER